MFEFMSLIYIAGAVAFFIFFAAETLVEDHERGIPHTLTMVMVGFIVMFALLWPIILVYRVRLKLQRG